jgi:hypothetical protein
MSVNPDDVGTAGSARRVDMTWRDKLELGLKNDAAYRKDNLTPSEIRGPEIEMGPGRSPLVPMARGDTSKVARPDAPGAADVKKKEPSQDGA